MTNPGSILIIDDEPLIRDLVTKILTEEGYQVRTACHGREALDVLQTHSFDLIISDLNMPKMDGKEFIREFRRVNTITPLLIITGALVHDGEIDGGVDLVLKKPFSAPVLVKTVSSIILHQAPSGG
ncbi:MAG: response regulator transcription factor [Desulfovibrionales bacterium]